MAALASSSLRSSSYTAAFLVLLAPLLLAVPQSLPPQSAVNITLANAHNFNQQAATSDASSDSLALFNAHGQPWLTKDSRASHDASSSNQGSASNSLSIQSAPAASSASAPALAGSLALPPRPRKRCTRHPRSGASPGSYGQPRPATYATGAGASPRGLAPGSNTSLHRYHRHTSRASQAYEQNTYSSTHAGYGGAASAGSYGSSPGRPGPYGSVDANAYDRSTGGYGGRSSGRDMMQRIGDRVGHLGAHAIDSVTGLYHDDDGYGQDGFGSDASDVSGSSSNSSSSDGLGSDSESDSDW